MSDAVQERYTKAMARMDQTNGWDAETEIKTILTQLHLDDLTQKIGTLSGGQAKRVGLAQVLIEQPDLLMLDEPTNHLDFDSVAWLEKYLAAYKGALLVVTHDRYFLDRVANKFGSWTVGSYRPSTVIIRTTSRRKPSKMSARTRWRTNRHSCISTN